MPPRRAIAYNPDISGQFTLDLLPGAAPHRLTMLPLHLQSSKDLVWDRLGSDPERWALWLGYHPFVVSINSGLSLRVALTELLSILKSTSTLEAINQRGWVIEMVVGTLAGLKARLFLLDPLRQPGRLEGVWRAFVEGTRVGLYSGVVVDKLMKVMGGPPSHDVAE